MSFSKDASKINVVDDNEVANKHHFKLAVIIFTLYLLLPIVVTFIYSVVVDWSTSWVPHGITFNNYVAIFEDTDFWGSLMRTVIMAVVPIVITTFILLLVMFVVVVFVPKLDVVVQMLCMLPYALQGVILSVGIISLYTGTGTFLSNRIIMLIGAYCVMVLPYIYQGIRNNLYGISANTLIEAAQMLGAHRIYAYWAIIVPNIMPGITVSMLLSIAIIFGDFVLANNIAGTAFKNIQVYLQQEMITSSGISSAVVVVIFVVVFILTGFVLGLQNKSEPET